jgi:hypothetical protein
MPIFFDENALTEEQRLRYDWAVSEYARIQEENRMHSGRFGSEVVSYKISPKSALFARLLEGKQPLPYPPPTSFSYPWYDIIEVPGPHHVSIGGGLSVAGIVNWDGGAASNEHIALNQCLWGIVRKNRGAEEFLVYLRQENERIKNARKTCATVMPSLSEKPEFVVTYGQWGEFSLTLGRIVRRGRRDSINVHKMDLHTLDGGNPAILKVLISGDAIRAKADVVLADLRSKMEVPGTELSSFEMIALATESAILRTDNPESEDLVEYACDGWMLEKR